MKNKKHDKDHAALYREKNCTLNIDRSVYEDIKVICAIERLKPKEQINEALGNWVKKKKQRINVASI